MYKALSYIPEDFEPSTDSCKTGAVQQAVWTFPEYFCEFLIRSDSYGYVLPPSDSPDLNDLDPQIIMPYDWIREAHAIRAIETRPTLHEVWHAGNYRHGVLGEYFRDMKDSDLKAFGKDVKKFLKRESEVTRAKRVEAAVARMRQLRRDDLIASGAEVVSISSDDSGSSLSCSHSPPFDSEGNMVSWSSKDIERMEQAQFPDKVGDDDTGEASLTLEEFQHLNRANVARDAELVAAEAANENILETDAAGDVDAASCRDGSRSPGSVTLYCMGVTPAGQPHRTGTPESLEPAKPESPFHLPCDGAPAPPPPCCSRMA